MKYITVYDIEGIPKSEIGYTKELYSYTEMVNYKDYDMSQLDIDTDVQERDHPAGWVIQKREDGKWIFVPVFEFEKWEYKEDSKCCGNCAVCTCKEH